MPTFERYAYAVFKGGGVAGMAHVGALQELEPTFKFIGYAGTSAGSLVALLGAAGLNAVEMRGALGKLDLRSLVGPYRYLVRSAPIILLLGWFCFITWPIAWFIFHQLPVPRFMPRQLPVGLGWTLASISLVAALLVLYVNLLLGLVPRKRLREFLVREVKTKIPDFDRHTTFRRFRELGGLPLKVFGTDLSGKALKPFGEDADDGPVPVVDAVVASAAFPLFFRPARIFGRYITDGGIAANLPIFSFERELGERRLPVVAFDLIWQNDPKKGRFGMIDFLVRIIATAIQSHDAILEKYLKTRSYRVKIVVPKEIEVMDFSLTDIQRDELFKAGSRAAEEFLRVEAVKPFWQAQTQKQYVQAQYSPEALVIPLLRSFCRDAEEQLGVPQPRACIFMGVSDSVRKIVYHTFADTDPDKDLELTVGQGITGIAWDTKRFTFGVLPGQGLEKEPEKVKIVKSDRNTAFCVPLFRVDVPGRGDLLTQPIFGVLVLDSSATIDVLGWAKDATKLYAFGSRWAATFANLFQ